jgi:magnesium transporter
MRRVTLPGTPPGTIEAAPGGIAPAVSAIAFGPEEVIEHKGVDLNALGDLLAKFPVVWVNVVGLGDASCIERIGKIFDLHRLALEDVVNVDQRPKVEHYGDYMYIVARMPAFGEDRLITEQFSMFLGKNFVVSFDERPGDCLEPVRERIRHKRGKIRETGPDYLAYTMLDAIVDAYFPMIESLGERLEQLEDDSVEHLKPETPRKLLEARHDLITFRRAVWPLRDTLSSLYRDETHLITADTQVYVRDCYDHALQLLDVIDTYREIANGLNELYNSGVSNRMNEVIKVLTLITTIFIPLSFIAGIYGMNFNPQSSPWNMPELDWYWGYPASLLLMAVIAAGLLYYFRRKGWLGANAPSPRDDK